LSDISTADPEAVQQYGSIRKTKVTDQIFHGQQGKCIGDDLYKKQEPCLEWKK